MKSTDVRSLKLLMSLVLMSPLGALAAGREELPMSVQPSAGGDVSAAPASGATTRSGQSDLLVRIHNSCFGTNLRSVANPLSPNSVISAKINIAFGNQNIPIEVKYPSEIVTPQGMTSTNQPTSPAAQALLKPLDSSAGGEQARELVPSAYKLPDGGTAGVYGSVVQIKVPAAASVTVNPDGSMVTTLQGRPSVTSKSFNQEGAGEGGEFMGRDGELTASFDGITVAADNSAVDLTVSFPGQEGFCGGFHSPLMLFFSDARPAFSETSEFPLSPTGLTKWPEAGSPGYFLALDRDGNGKIDRREELFGDQSKKGMNGFLELAKFDKNKDMVINAKDKVFRRLRLWNDKNGDGISQKDELVPLASMGIDSISLRYDPTSLRTIGENAEERESSHFTYRKNGKEMKGAIVDMWFSPVMKRMAASEK